jgi:hypothetical protein
MLASSCREFRARREMTTAATITMIAIANTRGFFMGTGSPGI